MESGAAVNCIQVSHRSDAVEYGIAGISRLRDANIDALGRDPLTLEMEGAMRDWVVETLLQGAYLREYHLWEKDCKAYFALMAERNGERLAMKVRGGRTFMDLAKETLADFGVTIPEETLAAIEAMRVRVNVMKHEAGLELEHFIDKKEYLDAVAALETFWAHLAGCEHVVY